MKASRFPLPSCQPVPPPLRDVLYLRGLERNRNENENESTEKGSENMPIREGRKRNERDKSIYRSSIVPLLNQIFLSSHYRIIAEKENQEQQLPNPA